MPYIDSIEKIVTTYFSAITRKPFTYKGQVYNPKLLVASPLLFRGYTCPPDCGGCCPRFSLDYLPTENSPFTLKVHRREIELQINGSTWRSEVYSDLQDDHEDHHCRNLRKEDGRCDVHGRQPFSCDFELIRFIHYPDKTVITQKLFGRGWAFLRTDGQRGARCDITPITRDTIEDAVRKLKRLKQWAEHFHIVHCLDSVIKWAESPSRFMELRIPKDQLKGKLLRTLTDFQEPLVQIEGVE